MDDELNQINVIPLVDVMLVLLVIVLTTATFITTGQIPVDLAKAAEAADRKDVPVVITLTSQGQMYVNDSAVPENGLGVVLEQRSREPLVVLRADKVTILERFVQVVDELKSLGFAQVSLEVVKS